MMHPILMLLSAAILMAHTDTLSTRTGAVHVTVDDAGGCRLLFTTWQGDTLTTAVRSGFRSPQVSPDGALFAFLSGDRLEVFDPRGVPMLTLEAGWPYAVGWEGVAIARESTVTIHTSDHREMVRLPRPVVGMTWTQQGLLAATRTGVYLIKAGEIDELLQAEPCERIVWCGHDQGVPGCIVRGRSDTGDWVSYARWDGVTLKPEAPRPAAPHPPKPPTRGFPWPFLPDTLPPIGNSYGEYQRYGVTAYRHPGIDLMGSHYEPVYAVAPGEVKAALTTSGSYHWRVAIGDSVGDVPSEGWLYAHLDLASIAVSVGDTVAQGDYLGSLVPWPVADFTHLHFARIADAGATWDGQWLCTENPLLTAGEIQETDPPFFGEAGGALLAFCIDNTSTYLTPDSLNGEVDIIANVGDRIKSSWVVCAQEIRFSIYPSGSPAFPVIDDRLAVFFDGEIDVYQGGAMDQLIVPVLWKLDTVCPTAGDYDTRTFYHILTNSDGDSLAEVSDAACSFNTALLPDGPHVIRVTARDAAGNSATDSMTVTLVNGNPPLTLQCQRSGDDLLLSWRRMCGAAGYLVYEIPSAYSVKEGTLLAVVADTCFLVPQALLSGSEGYYRVVASDALGRFGVVAPASNTAAP